MNTEHVKIWTTMLREPGRLQVRNVLRGHVNDEGPYIEEGPVGNCCLGVLCEAAGLEPEVRAGADPDVSGDSRYVDYTFGEAGVTDLPPTEAFRWLGITSRRHHAKDEVYLHIPFELRPRDWIAMPPYDYVPGRVLGCAMLNDALHLSFSQIADLVDFFGLAEING